MQPHLTHLFMEVADLARARWFWVDVLGLRLFDDRGAYIAVGGNGGFSIGIEQIPLDRVTTAGPEITMRVEDVDASVATLRGAGIGITDGPTDMPWGARHAWLLDPDGRRMSIYSAAHSSMDAASA